jgi:multidrug efflux pump subunit AcrB
MVGFFIQRPVFASAIAVIMVLAGSICYFLLPVSQFPDITPPQVVVSASYPGAGAQVVAEHILATRRLNSFDKGQRRFAMDSRCFISNSNSPTL